jgi:arylsulfatase A-like enzyme
LRERTLARQKELGVIPPDAELTARHEEIPAWEDMPEELKPALRRQMENYAGFLEHTDHHVGLLLDALVEQGLLDDILIYYIIGDNGASAEGSPQGTFNELITLSNLGAELETAESFSERLDKIGGPESMPHYAVGWAHAMCTPYQWTKQVASYWGGTRNGTIAHWPAGISAKGELRHQFCHVIDVAPTVLEVTGIPEPTMVNGVTQRPMGGTSMRYSFDVAAAPERHETQYFEMMCNRGIYHKGWSAVTKHRTPWVTTGDITLFQDGDQVAAGRVERTEPIGFGYEYTDVGRDAQSPVADDYPAGDNTFTGTIKWIEMEGGQDSHDHLVDPGQVFHCHMTKQ